MGLDYVFGNELEVETHGKISGAVIDKLIDTVRKVELVKMISMQKKSIRSRS